MEDETPFFISELAALTRNPVIWPLLKNLVFVSKNDTGFFADNCLVTADGECSPKSGHFRPYLLILSICITVAYGTVFSNACLRKRYVNPLSRCSVNCM